jgi:hypothetical protein
MIQVEFDKPRQLFYDLAAIRDLEQALGGQPLGVIIQQLSNLGVNAMVIALWAGFKHEDRAITPNLVTKRLEAYLKDGKKLSVLADAVSEALDECGIFRTAEDDEKNVTADRPSRT